MGHRSCSFVKIGETTEWPGFWTWEAFYWWYIYIYFIQYRYRMYMFICYKNESTLQKVSRFKSFRFFGGEWLYRTQMKVDIYQAKGMLKVPFWWRLVKKKPHKWWEYHIFFLGNGELNDWIPSWTTGWLLSCWHLSIRSYLHWFPFPYHPWDW